MKFDKGEFRISYASLLAPTYPPRPMEIAPAASSARPPRTTTLVFPRADKPADRAKGTVRPSDRPRIASEMMRGLMRERVEPLLVDPSLLTQRPKVSYERCDSRSWSESPRMVSSSSIRARRGLPDRAMSVYIISTASEQTEIVVIGLLTVHLVILSWKQLLLEEKKRHDC